MNSKNLFCGEWFRCYIASSNCTQLCHPVGTVGMDALVGEMLCDPTRTVDYYKHEAINLITRLHLVDISSLLHKVCFLLVI